MLRTFSLLLLFLSGLTLAQSFNIEEVTTLNDELFESSGLLFLEDRVVTHNDSGDDALLYEVNQTTGEILRTVAIPNAGSIDWEDICKDDEFIYLGDFGNNSGTRTDLNIYRISIADYLTTPNDTVFCDTISFSYADQTSFEPATYSTNYDAEAIIAYNDSIYLFSKNWGNFETNIYAIPKEPGTYSVSIIDNINTEGLVTSAAYDPVNNEVILTGYTITTPFLFFIKGFEDNNFSSATFLSRGTPTIPGAMQVEGSCALGDHYFYISSETDGSGVATLNKVHVTDFISIAPICKYNMNLYPNPTNGTLSFSTKDNDSYLYFVYDTNGQIVSHGNTSAEIDISNLSPATYFVNLYNPTGKLILEQKVIKN